MESSHRFQEYQIPSPNSHSVNSSNSSSNSTTSNGLNHHHQSHNYYRHPSPRTPTAPIPLPITRSEPNSPYPTTFVQADSSTFKQVVQMLTGSSETAKLASGSGRQETTPAPAPFKNFPIPPIKPGMMRKDKSTSKLYERRNSLKNFKLSPLPSGLVNNNPVFAGSPRPEILSPSLLDFPSLALSPVTPLIPDPFNRSPPIGMNSNGSLNMEAEEKAIARKGFYLHPSPSTTPRESEPPRLLPLFPVTSPKVAGNSVWLLNSYLFRPSK